MRLSAHSLGLLLVALMGFPAGLRAQAPAVPEPAVRLSIAPQRVVVGQPATLRLVVLAPNYMTSPPLVPDFQMRNAATFPLGTRNQSEQDGATTLAGVVFEFAIYPLEPGSFALAGKSVTVTYAAAPPATRTTALPLPAIALEAFIPDAAADLEPFLAAESLQLEQTVRPSSEELKPGDAITRIVTAKGTGVPAMLLPPIAFRPVDGLSTYAAEPSLQSNFDPRTDQLSVIRVDQATFMAIKPGAYMLPAIEVGWWDVRNGRIARSSVGAVPLRVVAGAASAPAPSTKTPPRAWTVITLIRENKALSAVVLLGLLGLAAIAPSAARTATNWLRQQRDAYLASEAWSFRKLRAAARHNNPREVYTALLDWVRRLEPLAPVHNVATLTATANDAGLAAQVAALESQLFSRQSATDAWSARDLLHRLAAARRRLRRRSTRAGPARPLPAQLNPTDLPHVLPSHGWRPVAR